ALEWGLGTGQLEAGLALAGSLSRFWRLRNYWSEGRAWLEGALGQEVGGPGFPTAARARALFGLGVMAWRQGDFAVTDAALIESIELHRALGDKSGLARSLGAMANVLGTKGDLS